MRLLNSGSYLAPFPRYGGRKVENCIFDPPHLCFVPLYGVIAFDDLDQMWHTNPRETELSYGEESSKICLAVLTQCTNVTDRPMAIASRYMQYNTAAG